MKQRIRQAVILAGGHGTRLMPFTESNPKPMYLFEGKPFLEYLIKQVKGFGIERVLLLLGYMPDKIMDYFGDGALFDLKIEYVITPLEYETGLRIKGAENKLDDAFLLMYCDNYCPVDFEKLQDKYFTNGAKAQLTAYANRDGYTKNNLLLDDCGKVLVYDKKRASSNLLGVDIGYAIIDKSVVGLVSNENENFEKTVYPQLVEKRMLYAITEEHRYYSVGSWERIELTTEFFRPKKTAFLDRDGTLNVRAPRAQYIEKPRDFVWLPGAIEAVKLLKNNGYNIILITNQPGIARGHLTEDTLVEIHDKMLFDLRREGGDIDKIYYCPHNWDDGCFCRKPRPGMLYQAQKELSVNLRDCVLFGDDYRDIEAGESAGCTCSLVSEEYPLIQAVKDMLARKM